MLSRLTCLALLLTASLVTLPLSAAEPELLPISGPMIVSPASIKLIHHRQPQSLIVSGRTADGIAVDLTGAAKFRSGDEAVVLVENGIAKPRANGQTTITIEAVGQSISVPVVVELSPVERPLSFRHEVMPVLSKGGCNSGSCHGYSLGKGGFKLSLRGADPLKDHRYGRLCHSSHRLAHRRNPPSD